MNENDIAMTMQQRLADANIATVVYENQDANPERPFLFVQHVPVERVDNTLAGGQLISRGFMAVTAVIEEGAFASAAQEMLDEVSDLFPKGLRLTITGGVITIPRPVSMLAGFQDVADYRRVAQVFYDASAT